MNRATRIVRCCLVVAALGPTRFSAAQEPPRVGPATEERFPPLQLPEGFAAALWACDPLVEYPSVIARGPKLGTLLVAHDYTTGLGVEIVRRDEIRLLADTDGDGYADRSTVFAKGFNSIQGLAHHGDTVFAMHAPLLTALRDTDGDGVADERRDLLAGLGLPPEENPNRLHCANGVTVGHDGWLYLALGDRGCDVERPEGDRLLFQQGGILRCRADGSDLHVFSSGLRNIYDVALDEQLNVFVRDNENDGGDYMIRVCHCFHGSDHGYPYLYYEHPDEAMPPLADLGRGSSAGGTAYLETAFPSAYRRSLYFCEWGRAVVRYERERQGGGFAPMTESELAAGAENDPYGFKPTDLIVDWDGTLLVSDWGDGQRPKRGRGRIYRVRYQGEGNVEPAAAAERADTIDFAALTTGQLTERLDSPSYLQRVAAQDELQRRGAPQLAALQAALADGRLGVHGSLHATWIMARVLGPGAIEPLFELAESDADPRVRAQAVRALADLTDPVLARHRLETGRGDVQIAERLAGVPADDPRVKLEVLIALGRLKWKGAPDWLRRNPVADDAALDHAAQQMLRRADNWPGVVELFDGELRSLALRAVADRATPFMVDALMAKFHGEPDAKRRGDYTALLARVARKPAAWVYWGFRPPPRPADSVDWERTPQILSALNSALGNADTAVRAAALEGMMREDIPADLQRVAFWLRLEADADQAALIFRDAQRRPAEEARQLLQIIVSRHNLPDELRLSALRTWLAQQDKDTRGRLWGVAVLLDDGAVLAAIIDELGRPDDADEFDPAAMFFAKTASKEPAVRAAAIRALGARRDRLGRDVLAELLEDEDVRVRRAAAAAAGELQATDALPQLRKAAADPDAALRGASLTSLRTLKDPGAVPQAAEALQDPASRLAALAYLADFGGPEYLESVRNAAASSPDAQLQAAAVRTLAAWQDRARSSKKQRATLHSAIAQLQADSGTPVKWLVAGPLPPADADGKIVQLESDGIWYDADLFEPRFATGTDAEVPLGKPEPGRNVWVAFCELEVPEATKVEFRAGSSGTLAVRLGEKEIFRRDHLTAYRPYGEQFSAKLSRGNNVLLVRVAKSGAPPRLQVRFRRRSSKAEHEQLIQRALAGLGNANRGQRVFLNAEKSLCFKCHRVGEEGGRIGPDLSGVGRRFSRIHLIESILEPSRSIANGYATQVLALTDGRVLTGVKVSETDSVLTLGDAEGKTHEIRKDEIEVQQAATKSVMPEGLEKRVSERELLDLIAFLLAQKGP